MVSKMVMSNNPARVSLPARGGYVVPKPYHLHGKHDKDEEEISPFHIKHELYRHKRGEHGMYLEEGCKKYVLHAAQEKHP